MILFLVARKTSVEMFDIGIGELVALAVVGLLIFGPERLPKAAADAGRWVRQIREMASSARKEIVDSAGVDLADSVNNFKSLSELHPKRLVSGFLDDDDAPAAAGTADSSGDGTPTDAQKKPAQTFDPDLS